MNPADKTGLQPIFYAHSVAVIGSLREQWMGGYGVIKNMLGFGFSGHIYPINQSYSEVFGRKAYPTVNDVADAIDLAIIITPSHAVPAIAEQCIQKGIRAAVVVSDGFAESGPDGVKLQQEIVRIARRGGMRLIGPNTVGIVNTATNLITTPYLTNYSSIRRGTASYSSQTGIAGAHAMPLEQWAYPIGKLCDFGNKCDINEVDLLEYLANDPDTTVISMELEDIKDGQQFIDTARKAVARKPVLVLKPGRSEISAKAVASHAASLIGDDRIYDTALKQAGVIRLHTWHEFLEIPRVFASQPPPENNRLAIITISGGAGIMAIDAAIENGLAITQPSPNTLKRLAELSPKLANNPCDLGQITSEFVETYIPKYESIATAMLTDDSIDCAFFVLWATLTSQITEIAEMFQRLRQQTSKPMAAWAYGARLEVREELARQLEILGIPLYVNLETAVKALGVATKYSAIKRNLNTHRY